jgi:hypothetical protein
MAFRIVDLMVDLLPESEASFSAPCTAPTCRAAGTKEGPGVRRPGRPRPALAEELSALRSQLRQTLGRVEA